MSDQLELCKQCDGTQYYDDGISFGLVRCDRCFFGYEPIEGQCPPHLVADKEE